MTIDMSEEKNTIPEETVYNPQALTIKIPAGKRLRMVTVPDGELFLVAPADGDTDLIAVITVNLREARAGE